jgi:hypothetical protein
MRAQKVERRTKLEEEVWCGLTRETEGGEQGYSVPGRAKQSGSEPSIISSKGLGLTIV